MLIHRKKRPRYAIQAPLTSLIDIVFMLLIYFLLTTNFITQSGIDVKLPESSASADQNRQEITVYVDKAGDIFLGQQPVAFGALFGELQARLEKQADRLVVIKADRSIQLDKAVDVMDIAKAAGAQRLFLATEKKTGPAGGS